MNVLTGHWVSNCHSVMVTYFSWIEVLGGCGEGGTGGDLGEHERKRRRGEETKNKRYFFLFLSLWLIFL